MERLADIRNLTGCDDTAACGTMKNYVRLRGHVESFADQPRLKRCLLEDRAALSERGADTIPHGIDDSALGFALIRRRLAEGGE